MINLELVGRNIAELRHQKKMSQAEFAEVFNVSHQAVSKWETGNALAELSILDKIAQYYELTIDEIVHGLNHMKPYIEFEFAMDVIQYIQPGSKDNLMQLIPKIRKEIKESTGKDVPKIHLKDNIELDNLSYTISYKGEKYLHNSLTLVKDDMRAKELANYLKYLLTNIIMEVKHN